MKNFLKELFSDAPIPVESKNSDPDETNKSNLVKSTPQRTAATVGLITTIIETTEATANAAGGVAAEVVADNISGYTISTIIPTAIGTSALGGPVAPIIIGLIASILMTAGIAGAARYALNEVGIKLLKNAEERMKILEKEKAAQPKVSLMIAKEQKTVIRHWQNVVKENKLNRTHVLVQNIKEKGPELLQAFRAKK